MQKVIISKENFDSFQKNTLLTLEEANWFTQEEGFIPLPRKANKKNIQVVFLYEPEDGYFGMLLQKSKIIKWRVSQIIDKEGNEIGYILVIETMPSNLKQILYSLFINNYMI